MTKPAESTIRFGKLGSVRFARNPRGAGWALYANLGRGAGYRWGAKRDGRTMTLLRDAKPNYLYKDDAGRLIGATRHPATGKAVRAKWFVTGFTTNPNIHVYPGWW